jgi:RHS repeat-associated protein
VLSGDLEPQCLHSFHSRPDNTYVYGLGLISVTDTDGNQTHFLYGGLGSTTGVADDEGNVTASYGYDVFGALRSGSPGANEWLFTGEQRDSESGLYYLRARYYEPVIGRLCPNYDPTHIYVIIDGVCYDATSPACSAGVNHLLCDGESGLFGFRPEKALGDAFQWFSDNPEITSGIAASLGCVVFAGPTIFTAAGPGVTGGAAVVVVCGGAGAIAASTGVNPLSP